MKPLIDIIDTEDTENIIDEIMGQKKPKQLDYDEWLYCGCFIQKFKHPQLIGLFEVFQNNKEQTHIARCHTFKEALKLCEKNECNDSYLKF